MAASDDFEVSEEAGDISDLSDFEDPSADDLEDWSTIKEPKGAAMPAAPSAVDPKAGFTQRAETQNPATLSATSSGVSAGSTTTPPVVRPSAPATPMSAVKPSSAVPMSSLDPPPGIKAALASDRQQSTPRAILGHGAQTPPGQLPAGQIAVAGRQAFQAAGTPASTTASSQPTQSPASPAPTVSNTAMQGLKASPPSGPHAHKQMHAAPKGMQQTDPRQTAASPSPSSHEFTSHGITIPDAATTASKQHKHAAQASNPKSQRDPSAASSLGTDETSLLQPQSSSSGAVWGGWGGAGWGLSSLTSKLQQVAVGAVRDVKELTESFQQVGKGHQHLQAHRNIAGH